MKHVGRFGRNNLLRNSLLVVALVLCCLPSFGCQSIKTDERVIPRLMSEVPAQYLAYRFAADTDAPQAADVEEKTLPTVQADFDTHRQADALLRTVVSPDGQRVLALYATSELPQGIFRIDMYAADGKFLRNLTSPELACAFTPSVAWSPDGQWFAFIARRNELVKPSLPSQTPAAATNAKKNAPLPTPTSEIEGMAPTPTIGPMFAPVETFATEQIYLSDRDGFNIKPLTTKEGSIFFYLAWAPNGRADALAALACSEDEWQARAAEGKLPAGRPRLLLMDGNERLLDDRLTDVLPVWSPDASKIATAFETEVSIYDGTLKPTTGARLPLHDALLEASVRYDREHLQTQTPSTQPTGKPDKKPTKPAPTPAPTSPEPSVPLSFNSIVRVEWSQPETLYAQTGFMRIYANQTISNYLRWHTITLSPQAILLKNS